MVLPSFAAFFHGTYRSATVGTDKLYCGGSRQHSASARSIDRRRNRESLSHVHGSATLTATVITYRNDKHPAKVNKLKDER